MSPELKAVAPAGIEASCGFDVARLSSVTEWVIIEVLRHSTVWPARIWTVSGWKLQKPMSTTADAFGEAGAISPTPRPRPRHGCTRPKSQPTHEKSGGAVFEIFATAF